MTEGTDQMSRYALHLVLSRCHIPVGVMGAGDYTQSRTASRILLRFLGMTDPPFIQFPKFAKSAFNSLIILI